MQAMSWQTPSYKTPLETMDIWTLIGELFRKGTQSRCPRLLLCCITGKEIAAVTNEAQERATASTSAFTNVFVPTICGRCQKNAAPSFMAIEGFDVENNLPPNLRIELDEDFIREWHIFKLAADYCEKDISVIAKQIVDRKRLMKELSGCTAQIRSIKIVARPGGEGEMLETMPFFDIEFL